MEQGLDNNYLTVEKLKNKIVVIAFFIPWMLPLTIIFGITAIKYSTPFSVFLVLLVLLLAIPSSIYLLINAWLNRYYQNFRFLLQEQGILIHEGVITKTERHIPYGRIQNLNIHRGYFQRKHGIATLKIETAGFTMRAGSSYGSAEGIIPGIRNPEEIVELIRPKLGYRKEGLAEEIPVKEKIPTELNLLGEINENLKAIRNVIEKKD
ncbi:MAG: PH domain-containing protein [Candidatus Helarchaeota archaeon]|nr:PH domain-containing protein [Candidatus Helarchaeota archaeon]